MAGRSRPQIGAVDRRPLSCLAGIGGRPALACNGVQCATAAVVLLASLATTNPQVVDSKGDSQNTLVIRHLQEITSIRRTHPDIESRFPLTYRSCVSEEIDIESEPISQLGSNHRNGAFAHPAVGTEPSNETLRPRLTCGTVRRFRC